MVHAESDRLHNVMASLQNQKDRVSKETAELRVRTTTALLDGQDVACLLYSTLMDEKLLESIDIALPEVQHQIDALRPELHREVLAGMQAEKALLMDTMRVARETITAADCHHLDLGGDGKIDPEKERRASEARTELDRLSVKLMQMDAEIRQQH